MYLAISPGSAAPQCGNCDDVCMAATGVRRSYRFCISALSVNKEMKDASTILNPVSEFLFEPILRTGNLTFEPPTVLPHPLGAGLLPPAGSLDIFKL